MKLILFLSLIVLCLCCLDTVESGRLYTIENFKYYVSYPTTVNWYKALEACAYNGMYLVDVRTYFEQVRLNKVMEKIKNEFKPSNNTLLHFWTSGTNSGHGNDFYWMTTGEPVSWTNWCIDYPKDRVDSCIHGHVNDNYMWLNLNCTNYESLYICRSTVGVPLKYDLSENNNASIELRRRKIRRHSRKQKFRPKYV